MTELLRQREVAAAIREFRARTGLTQEILAREAKVSPRHLRRLERCCAPMNIAILRRLARSMTYRDQPALAMVLSSTIRAEPDDDTGSAFERRLARVEARLRELEDVLNFRRSA